MRIAPSFLDRCTVRVTRDNPFQQRARLLQHLWREHESLPVGDHRGRPLGSRLAMPEARERLGGFVTETVREVVRSEVLDGRRARGKLYGKPRIFNDLLSSQPLCFNLFGELQRDLDLLTKALRRRVRGLDHVETLDFEYSPGRGDHRFLADRSAFDVFLRYKTRGGERAFLGFEVKYAEDLRGRAAAWRQRYEVVADRMGVFDEAALPRLRRQPLQQLWRDHLLAGSMLQADLGYTTGRFVVLHPRDNLACARATEDYRACLTAAETYDVWTLESLVDDLRVVGAGTWLDRFYDRYLAFEKLHRFGIPPLGTTAFSVLDPMQGRFVALLEIDETEVRTVAGDDTLAPLMADAAAGMEPRVSTNVGGVREFVRPRGFHASFVASLSSIPIPLADGRMVQGTWMSAAEASRLEADLIAGTVRR